MNEAEVGSRLAEEYEETLFEITRIAAEMTRASSLSALEVRRNFPNCYKAEFDVHDPQFSMAVDDGVVQAITEKGAGLLGDYDKKLLRVWTPRSVISFNQSARNILGAYHWSHETHPLASHAQEARITALARFEVLSAESALSADDLNALKLGAYSSLLESTYTLQHPMPMERHKRLVELKQFATDKFGVRVLIREIDQEFVETPDLSEAAVAEAATLIETVTESGKDKRWRRRARQTLFVSTAVAGAISTLSQPAAAAEPSANIVMQTPSPDLKTSYDSLMATLPALPLSIFADGTAGKVRVPRQNVIELPYNSSTPQSAVAELPYSPPAHQSAATHEIGAVSDQTPAHISTKNFTRTHNTQVAMPSAIFGASKGGQVEASPPLVSTNFSKADRDRLAASSGPELQIALFGYVESLGFSPVLPESNNISLQADTLSARLLQSGSTSVAARKALSLFNLGARYPTAWDAIRSDPALRWLPEDVLQNASNDYPVEAYNAATNYEQTFDNASPSDISDYPTDLLKGLSTSYAVAEASTHQTNNSDEFTTIPAAAFGTNSEGSVHIPHGKHARRHSGFLLRKHEKQQHAAPNKYNTGNFKQTWDFFSNDNDLRLSPVGVAALLGNFAEESAGTMDPRIVQGGSFSSHLLDSYLNKAGYGINQATSESRQLHLRAVANRMGLPEGSLAAQHQFIKEELMGYPSLLHTLRENAPHKLSHMTYVVRKDYERPSWHADTVREHYAHLIYRANTGHHAVHHVVGHEQSSGGLFVTTTELPQAHQVVQRAKQLARMSPDQLSSICGPSSGQSCYHRCARLAAQAWGRDSSGWPTALDQWRVAEANGQAHANNRHVPVGALLYYGTGKDAGHVAVYLGNGKVLSNDVKDDYHGEGGAYIVPARALEGDVWNLQYLGWSPPNYHTGHVSGWNSNGSQNAGSGASVGAHGHAHAANQGNGHGHAQSGGNGNGSGHSSNGNGGSTPSIPTGVVAVPTGDYTSSSSVDTPPSTDNNSGNANTTGSDSQSQPAVGGDVNAQDANGNSDHTNNADNGNGNGNDSSNKGGVAGFIGSILGN